MRTRPKKLPVLPIVEMDNIVDNYAHYDLPSVIHLLQKKNSENTVFYNNQIPYFKTSINNGNLF